MTFVSYPVTIRSMRTFEYRLFVNKEQSRLLMACLAESRKLYNEMLSALKAHYEQNGTFPSKYDLTAQFKGRGGEHVPATTVQMLADRDVNAAQNILERARPGHGLQELTYTVGCRVS